MLSATECERVIGAYKVLAGVLPNCASYIASLDKATAGLQSKDAVP